MFLLWEGREEAGWGLAREYPETLQVWREEQKTLLAPHYLGVALVPVKLLPLLVLGGVQSAT